MTLTPKQAAARAGMSPSLVYAWCDERLLPHYRLGRTGKRGRILIEEGDLSAFLAGLKLTGGGRPAPAPVLTHLRVS